MDELNRRLASEDVRIVPYIDRDDLVRATVSKVGRTIPEGIGLVFLILILFLGSPRSALVAVVSIPLALVAVFSLLNLTKVSANLLSLGAIDFGILVDGAIVVTEAILRRREAMPDEELSESEVKAAAVQVTRPIFFASLIIITAYLPLFSFERAEAQLFTPMAYTMGYALFGALLTALALVPALAYYAFRKPGRVYHNRWLERLTHGYERRAGGVHRAAAHRLRHRDFRLAGGGRSRRHRRAGLPAGPGRGSAVAAGADANRAGAQQGERHGERAAP